MQPHVRTLYVENLKSFAGQHKVDLAPLTLIYGPNAAGKSTALQSLRVLRDYLKQLNHLSEPDEWEATHRTLSRLASGHDAGRGLRVGVDFPVPSAVPGSGTGIVRTFMLGLSTSTHHEAGLRMVISSSEDGLGGSEEPVLSELVVEPASPPVSWQYRWPRGSSAGTREVRTLLMRTFFLGPYRGSPTDPYPFRRAEFRPWYLDANPTVLKQEDERINAWLARLEVPYEVRSVSIAESDPEYAAELALVDWTADWADDSIPIPTDTIDWELIDKRSEVLVRREEVGHGVSQLLPILDVCLRDDRQVICIEQPELHLHPRLAARLGELLVDAVVRGNQVVAETHSESIFLRVRRLIREGAIPASDVAVLYVDNHADHGAWIDQLRLGQQGEQLDPWPTGFFDDSLADILGITE